MCVYVHMDNNAFCIHTLEEKIQISAKTHQTQPPTSVPCKVITYETLTVSGPNVIHRAFAQHPTERTTAEREAYTLTHASTQRV